MKVNEMNIVSLNGHTFDLDEVVLRQIEPASVHLTFRNGDRILLPWRDQIERGYILGIIEMRTAPIPAEHSAS